MAERGSPNLCCCCSLTTGGIIIGVLDVIGGIILTILSIAGLIVSASEKRQKENQDPDYSDSVNTTVLDTIFSILLIISFAVIVLGVVMLYGINKKSPFLLKIWIIFKVVSLIIVTIYNIIKYSALGSISGASIGAAVATYVFADIISYALIVWFIVVIHFLGKEFQGGVAYEPVHYSKP